MNLSLKHLILSLIIIPFFFSCQSNKVEKYSLDGIIQGSYYHIVYYATYNQDQEAKRAIKQLFKDIDNSVSLWEKGSIINQINQNLNPVLDTTFIECFNKSQEISSLSSGSLDCTIGALVEKYGFAAKARQEVSQEEIDSLLQYVGYKNVIIENKRLKKKYPETKIDLNAIAQGYTTDKISELLISEGIKNFIVDITGEVRASGKKEDNKSWLCAIEQPADSANQERQYNTYIELNNSSIVTSGSYRKYYIDKEGKKKSHTIDPKTGKSVEHTLLSVSVICPSAILADGLATSFMVMGLEKAKEFLKDHPNLKAHFIYWKNNQYQTYTTPNLIKELKSLH
ncbi:MAG: FAD:protein FMN transferase [Bacteroidales bacterium]|nr:FAD:protein FMN transferase [Bacteroidales bacterium]